MFRTNLIVYSLLVAFSLWLIFWAVPTQTPSGIGYGLPPAFLPRFLSVLMLITSSWLLITTLVTRARQQGPSPIEKEHFIQMLKFIPLLLIAFPLMAWISSFQIIPGGGFIPVTIILLCTMQYMTGDRNIRRMAIISVSIALLSYVGILYGMQVPLP